MTYIRKSLTNDDAVNEFKSLIGMLIFPFLAAFILILLNLIIDNIHSWFKSFLVGAETRAPIIPFPQDNLHIFKGSNDLIFGDAKILVSNEKVEMNPVSKRISQILPSKTAIDKMNEWIIWLLKTDEKLVLLDEEGFVNRPTIPNNTRTISIKMDGFNHGEKCHDFVPTWDAVPGGYCTYQMYGDNRIQVTNYHERGVSYVAGFCIYIEKPWISALEYRRDVVQGLMTKTPKIDKPPEQKVPKKEEVKPMAIPMVPHENRFLLPIENRLIL